MTIPIIKTATASDEASAIAVVALAFSTDPAARWTWPEPDQFMQHFPSVVRVFGGKAFAHESAYYVDGYAGAALWLPPGVGPDIPLYERHGFELLGTIQVGASPPIFPMLRTPRRV